MSDGGGELIPPLGVQTGEELVLGPGALEWWDHQTVVRRPVGGGWGCKAGGETLCSWVQSRSPLGMSVPESWI